MEKPKAEATVYNVLGETARLQTRGRRSSLHIDGTAKCRSLLRQPVEGPVARIEWGREHEQETSKD